MEFLETLVTSYLGPNKSVKFITDGVESEVATCPAEVLPYMCDQHPLRNLLNSAVQSHHKTFSQGTSTFCAFVYLWWKELQIVIRETGIDDDFSIFHSITDRCVEFLNNKSFSLNSILNDHRFCDKTRENYAFKTLAMSKTKVNVNSVLMKSRHFTCVEEPSELSDDLRCRLKNIVLKLSHGSDDQALHLSVAWINQIEHNFKRTNFIDYTFDMDKVHIYPSVKTNSTSVIVGYLFRVSPEVFNLAAKLKNIRKRALFIDGELSSNYRHVGYKPSVKSTMVTGEVVSTLRSPSVHIAWLRQALTHTKGLAVNLIIVSRSADQQLITMCAAKNIIVIDNTGVNVMKQLSETTGVSSEAYLLNCHQSNIVDLIVDPFLTTSTDTLLQLSTPSALLQTIVVHGSSEALAEVRKHRLLHIVNRLHSVASDCDANKVLKGKGCAERECAEWIRQHFIASEPKLNFYVEHVANVLLNYEGLVRKNVTLTGDNYESSEAFDELASKTEAFKSAMLFTQLIVRSDSMVITGCDEGSEDPLRNFPQGSFSDKASNSLVMNPSFEGFL